MDLMVPWTSFTFQQKSTFLLFSQERDTMSNVYRYILNEEYQAERPFIWRENAHLDITFSCVAFLNSCISLLPEYTTVAQRAAIIVQGLHGMEIYANKFWCTHLLEYCSLLHQQRQFSTELLTQLQLLLRFRKDGNRAPIPTSQARMKEELAEDTKLEALNHWPDIKSLVSDILVFRARIKKEDESEKSFKSTPPLKESLFMQT